MDVEDSSVGSGEKRDGVDVSKPRCIVRNSSAGAEDYGLDLLAFGWYRSCHFGQMSARYGNSRKANRSGHGFLRSNRS